MVRDRTNIVAALVSVFLINIPLITLILHLHLHLNQSNVCDSGTLRVNGEAKLHRG